MIALYIILAILLLIFVILVIPIRAVIRFCADEKSVYLKILFIKIPLYPREKKAAENIVEQEKNEEEKQKKVSDDMLSIAWTMRRDIKECLSRVLNYTVLHTVKTEELNVSLVFGTGDPMYTGLLCGAVYPIYYNSTALLRKKKILKKHYEDIRPDFNNLKFEAGIYVVFKTRLFHFAVIAGMILKLAVKFLRLSRKKK